MENKQAMTFVLSDESVNSHGTWVKTSGIDLKRFKANPVMLWSHDSAFPPIGKWVNIRVEGDRLLADAEFDEKDALAQALKSKVEQGLLKACSIGFYAKKFSNKQEDIKPGQTYETITESEIIEASLCAVGSNANAMKLYTDEGELIELSNESGRRLSGMKRLTINQDKNMTEEEARVLLEENEQLKAYKAQKEQEEAQREETQRKELVANAIKSGKITKNEEAVWLQLAKDNYESAKLALDAIKPYESIAERMRVAQGGSQSKYARKSWRELDRMGRLAQLKAEDRELFERLYKEEFGKEYKG